MKALSIRQPYADLLLGPKDVENRTWPTSFRGRCYIHASKTVDWEAELTIGRQYPGRRELGAIIGEMTIVDCVTESDSEWFEGPYGFVRTNPVRYARPIPMKGHLGLWDVILP